MKTITIGRGYRRLKPGERLRVGDQFFAANANRWLVTGNVGRPVRNWKIYRRRKAKKASK